MSGGLMVLVGGPAAGQLAPADRDIWRAPRRSPLAYVEYHRHRIIAGTNVYSVGVPSARVWPNDITQTTEAYAALLALGPSALEHCLVATIPEPGPGQVS